MANVYRLDKNGRPYVPRPNGRGIERYLQNSVLTDPEWTRVYKNPAEEDNMTDEQISNLGDAIGDRIGAAIDKKMGNPISSEDAQKGISTFDSKDLEAYERALHERQLKEANTYLAKADVYRKRHQVGFIAGVAFALGGAYALGRLDVSARGEDDLDLGVDGERNFRVVGG